MSKFYVIRSLGYTENKTSRKRRNPQSYWCILQILHHHPQLGDFCRLRNKYTPTKEIHTHVHTCWAGGREIDS